MSPSRIDISAHIRRSARAAILMSFRGASHHQEPTGTPAVCLPLPSPDRPATPGATHVRPGRRRARRPGPGRRSAALARASRRRARTGWMPPPLLGGDPSELDTGYAASSFASSPSPPRQSERRQMIMIKQSRIVQRGDPARLRRHDAQQNLAPTKVGHPSGDRPTARIRWESFLTKLALLHQ